MSHWSTNEQLVCGPTSKSNPSQANERVGPLVQDLKSVLKGTTSLLSLKVGRSEFHLAPHVASHSPSLTPEMGGLLSRRTWATLTHANLRIILNNQEFMVSLGLKLSYQGYQMKKKSISTVNDIIKWEWLFMVRSYALKLSVWRSHLLVAKSPLWDDICAQYIFLAYGFLVL